MDCGAARDASLSLYMLGLHPWVNGRLIRAPPKPVILSVTEGGAKDLQYLLLMPGAKRRSTKS
jgi:hypothetical protein